MPSYLDDEAGRDVRLRDLRLSQRLKFAYGRLRLINAVLAYQHWGPCRTDDGEIYLDLMLPYAVEIAHLDPACDFKRALPRFRYWLPKLMAELGEEGFSERWDKQAELRSIALSHNRSEAAAGHILHLPTAAQICETLRITRALRDDINALYPGREPIRTVGVIDPPTEAERREMDRLRKETKRRSAGVQPQSARTLTQDRAILANEIGCSARTLGKYDTDPIKLLAFLGKRGIDVQKVSVQYVLGNCTGQILETPEVGNLDGTAGAMLMLQESEADAHADAYVDPYIGFLLER